jgi:hypothetical protein
MAVPSTYQDPPYAALPDETDDDTTVGQVNVTVTLNFVGQIANVQADWNTLLATNFASPSVVASYGAD